MTREKKIILATSITPEVILDPKGIIIMIGRLIPEDASEFFNSIYEWVGRATAEEISEQTARARAVESAYLNQLVIMGYLKKERKGRKAYFYADRESQR